jgi:hypothetical protein
MFSSEDVVTKQCSHEELLHPSAPWFLFEVLSVLNVILTDSVTASNLITKLASCFTPSDEMQESSYLLEELARDAQHHTTEVLCLSTREQSSEWSVAADVTRRTNTVVNDASFELDLIVLSVVASKSG